MSEKEVLSASWEDPQQPDSIAAYLRDGSASPDPAQTISSIRKVDSNPI